MGVAARGWTNRIGAPAARGAAIEAAGRVADDQLRPVKSTLHPPQTCEQRPDLRRVQGTEVALEHRQMAGIPTLYTLHHTDGVADRGVGEVESLADLGVDVRLPPGLLARHYRRAVTKGLPLQNRRRRTETKPVARLIEPRTPVPPCCTTWVSSWAINCRP